MRDRSLKNPITANLCTRSRGAPADGEGLLTSHEARHTIDEIEELRRLARRAGVNFGFPVRVYGVAALVSAALLASQPMWLYTSWWVAVACVAPMLVVKHYRAYLHRRGIGIDRHHALGFVLAAELIAVVLWVQPFHPPSFSLPWIGLVVAAFWAGGVWRDAALCLVAAGVLVAVVVAASLRTPMTVTDAAIGAWLCLIAPWWQWRARRPASGRRRTKSWVTDPTA